MPAQLCGMKSSFLIPAIVGIGLLATASCGTNSSANANDAPPGVGANSGPEAYSVVAVAPGNLSAHLDFPATMQGVQVVEIRPMISGYIGTIGVQEGSTVRKGQLLFTIDNPQYAQAVRSEAAAVASAEATLATAEQNVTKVKPLVDEDIVSKFELTAAENTLEADRAALDQAKAALQNARVNLAYTIIRSPFDGVIGTIPYKTGALVGTTSADALTTLSDISQVYAYFSLDEKQLLQLLNDDDNTSTQEKLNRIPPVSLVLANGAVYPLKGKLQTASGLVTTGTGSTSFKALFANPQGLIRSGASAILRIPRRYDSVLVVPQSATTEIQDKRLVYIVAAGNKIRPVTITGAPTDDGKYYIVTAGLAYGDRIVLSGISSLKDGLVIKPVEVASDSVYSQLKAEE
jgi:membrane fusion protein (multidrug efflux system)